MNISVLPRFFLVLVVALMCSQSPGLSQSVKADDMLDRLTGTWRIECTEDGPVTLSRGVYSQGTDYCWNNLTAAINGKSGRITILLRIGLTDEILRKEYHLTLERGKQAGSYALTVERQALRPSPQEKVTLLRSIPMSYSAQTGLASTTTHDKTTATIQFDNTGESAWDITPGDFRVRVQLRKR